MGFNSAFKGLTCFIWPRTQCNISSPKIIRILIIYLVCLVQLCPFFFDYWLTVHRSIILFDLQPDAQNSYLFTYNTFIRMPRNRLPRVMKRYSQLAEGIMADLWRVFWIRETGTGQQVAQLHDRYMMMMMIIHLLKSSTRFEHYPAHLQEVLYTG